MSEATVSPKPDKSQPPNGTRLPWFKSYPEDVFLAETVLMMSSSARGANYVLLHRQWWSVDGKLPVDDKKLAVLAAMPESEWTVVKPEVMTNFVTDGTQVWNEKLFQQWVDANAKSKIARESGSRGGKERHRRTQSKDNQPQGTLKAGSSEVDLDLELKEERERNAGRTLALTAPSREEVKTYFQQRNFTASPERFFNHFAGLGWEVHGTPITDWRRFADNWEARERKPEPTPAQTRRPGLLTELLDAARWKLAAKGYTQDAALEFRRLKETIKAKTDPSLYERLLSASGWAVNNRTGDLKVFVDAQKVDVDEVRAHFGELLLTTAREMDLRLQRFDGNEGIAVQSIEVIGV